MDLGLGLMIGGAITTCAGSIVSNVSKHNRQEDQWDNFLSNKQDQWNDFMNNFGKSNMNDQENPQ